MAEAIIHFDLNNFVISQLMQALAHVCLTVLVCVFYFLYWAFFFLLGPDCIMLFQLFLFFSGLLQPHFFKRFKFFQMKFIHFPLQKFESHEKTRIHFAKLVLSFYFTYCCFIVLKKWHFFSLLVCITFYNVHKLLFFSFTIFLYETDSWLWSEFLLLPSLLCKWQCGSCLGRASVGLTYYYRRRTWTTASNRSTSGHRRYP